MTLVPTPTITATGVVVPPQTGTGSILGDATSGVLGDLNAAFGGNLNVTNLQTPQGQLASSIAAYIADSNALFAYFVSQTDPQYAEGFMQDALAAIFNLTRLPATATTVTCTCTGAAGTVIPAGSQAQDTSGNVYQSALDGTIGGGGTVSIVFDNILPGPIGCAHGTLTRIMSTTPGWDSITNPGGTDTLPTTLGRDIESSSAFEARRQLSLKINGQSSTDSILGAVLACDPNIVDATVIDNPDSGPVLIGSVIIPPHSVYVSVQGNNPSEAAIAAAIWSKKPVGCGYGNSTAFTGSIAGATLTVATTTFGFLAVGQTIEGAGIPTSTITIATLGTGTGGPGTYGLSASVGTITSEAMTSATEVVVYDTQIATPYPAYPVKWNTPAVVGMPITVNIPASTLASLPSDYATLIDGAISNAFLGLDGGPKSRIGETFYASRYYAPIVAAVPGIQISSIKLFGSSDAAVTGINQYYTPGTITITFV